MVENIQLLDFLQKVDNLFPISLSQKCNLNELQNKLNNFGVLGIVSKQETIVSICAGYANDKVNKIAYISIVATLPEYMGNGYGKMAVQKFIDEAKKAGMKAIHLYTVKGNDRAIKMYKSLGFIEYIIKYEPRPQDIHFILYLS